MLSRVRNEVWVVETFRLFFVSAIVSLWRGAL